MFSTDGLDLAWHYMNAGASKITRQSAELNTRRPGAWLGIAKRSMCAYGTKARGDIYMSKNVKTILQRKLQLIPSIIRKPRPLQQHPEEVDLHVLFSQHLRRPLPPTVAIASPSSECACSFTSRPFTFPSTPAKYASVLHTPCSRRSCGTKCSQAVRRLSYHFSKECSFESEGPGLFSLSSDHVP